VFVASLAGVLTLLLVLSILGGVFGLEESGDDLPIFDVLFAITLFTIVLGVPAAYLIAIFRYRLWDLDVVIKKAAVALVLTGLLVGIGLLLIGILGRTAVSEGNALGVVVGLIAGAAVSADQAFDDRGSCSGGVRRPTRCWLRSASASGNPTEDATDGMISPKVPERRSQGSGSSAASLSPRPRGRGRPGCRPGSSLP
jgi:hypothetical protein